MDKENVKLCRKIWAKNKYLVLSKSQTFYREIREYLKQEEVRTDELEAMIDRALLLEEQKGEVINSLQHIWGYFKKLAQQQEKEEFFSLIAEYEQGRVCMEKPLGYLFILLKKYPNNYLKNSNIFDLLE